MAMVRIPTAESGGKANVHLGGIGIGIDVAKGRHDPCDPHNRQITELPHGGSPSGIPIPYWDEILLISSRIQQITNIGYIAVDITLDRDMGPMLCKGSERARGTHGAGKRISRRFEAASNASQDLTSARPKKACVWARNSSGKDASEIPLKGPAVLGIRESIAVAGSGGSVEILARIEPDRERSAFHRTSLQGICGARHAGTRCRGQRSYRVKFARRQKVQTAVESTTFRGPERAVIGKRDLRGFLIDPSYPEAPALPSPSATTCAPWTSCSHAPTSLPAAVVTSE